MIIKEENGTQRKKCVEQIRKSCPIQLRAYLDTPLKNLPSIIKDGLNPNGALFKSVASNTVGSNKFIDYLRLNLYAQFGITRGSILTHFIQGISRIACEDLNFYSFTTDIKGPEILRFSRVLNLLKMKPELVTSKGDIDANLNGMDYIAFMEYFKDAISSFKNNMNKSIDNYKPASQTKYRIIRIPDHIVESGYGTVTVLPTAKGREFLDSLSPYVDWCICNSPYADQEYAQYLANGGTFYVCLRDGFEDEERIKGENCPLDSYGLSMIAVIIGTDGMPENITTRWNHDMEGENNENLWNAEQLQKILDVDFRSIFKPRKTEELQRMYLSEVRNKKKKTPSAMSQVHGKVNAGIMDGITGNGMFEGAEPETDKYMVGLENGNDSYCHVKESFSTPKALKDMAERKNPKYSIGYKAPLKSIAQFMKDDGLNVYPYPKVKLNWDEQDGIFIKTGYYVPENKEIVLFCNGRHPKDILRSFAHEMIHHSQNLDGKNLSFTNNDNVKDNEDLEKIEGEAYLKGNLYFRKWTEYISHKQNKMLNETIDLEAMKADDVDLSSFDIKKKLNPKFWKDEKLDSRVRIRLLDIADDFIEFLGIDNLASPIDIILTGSLANYNWNRKFSDIDLHILMDFSEIDKRIDFVKKYFDAKKNEWNDKHNIKILGFSVEVYVQDIHEIHKSSGVYSLETNTWITRPSEEYLRKGRMNPKYIKNKVAGYINKIDNLYDIFKASKGNDPELRSVNKKAYSLFRKIKGERKRMTGEMSNGNIIFKSLRRLKYLKKLSEIMIKSYDELKSLS